MPIAVAGLKPKRKTSIGVMSDPPPIPVMPTRTPTARPARTNCQVTEGRVPRARRTRGRPPAPRRARSCPGGRRGSRAPRRPSRSPVRFSSSPARAFAYRPFVSRSAASSGGDVDEDLDELALGEQRPRRLAVGAERRDERGDDDEPRVGHELRDLGGAAVVLRAVGVREAEVLRRPWRRLSPSSIVRVPARARAAAARAGSRSSTCRRRGGP